MVDIDQLVKDLSKKAPAKPMPHPFVSLLRWAAGAGVYVALLMLCSHIRLDFEHKLESPLFLAEIGLLVCMILTSGLSIAVLSFPDLHQKRWAMLSPFVTLALFCGVLALEWFEDTPSSPKPDHNGLDCLLCIIGYSIIPASWIFYRLRKLTPTHGATAGFVALLGACSIGCLALRLSEKTDSVAHLVEWHYLPMLVFSILGLWLGKKLLKW